MPIGPAHHHILQSRGLKEGLDQLEGSGDPLLAYPMAGDPGYVLAAEGHLGRVRLEKAGDKVQGGPLLQNRWGQ